MITVKKILDKRGSDDWGDGSFQAPRGKDKNKKPKYHKGIDYKANVNDPVFSPVKGSITRIGYPYPPKPGEQVTFRYVEVTDYKGNRHRVFYIDPSISLDQHVDTTTIIGVAQDISGRYHDPDRAPMINHVHYEIFNPDGELINPEEFV